MAEQWYDCQVLQAGPASDGSETAEPVVYIRLTDSGQAFTGYWFFAAENSRNEMLAVALAALSTGKRVSAAVDVPVDNNSSYTQIHRLYLNV
jgi:hypothetical protein